MNLYIFKSQLHVQLYIVIFFSNRFLLLFPTLYIHHHALHLYLCIRNHYLKSYEAFSSNISMLIIYLNSDISQFFSQSPHEIQYLTLYYNICSLMHLIFEDNLYLVFCPLKNIKLNGCEQDLTILIN